MLFDTVIPVAAIVAIGFWAGKTLDLDISTLSRLSLYILFPVLTADSLDRTTLSLQNTLGLSAGTILTYILLCLLAWAIGQRLHFSPDVQKSFLATTAFPNAGNVGLPVTLFALGEAGLERAIVYMIISAIAVNLSGPALLKGGGFWSSMQFTLQLPLVWGTIAGLGLYVIPAPLPFNLGDGLHLLGQATIPIALLLLGLQMASNPVQVSRYDGFASLMRLVGGAIVSYLVGKSLGLAELDFQVLVLQSSMPAAVGSFLMVREFGGDASRTARAIVVSTLLAFFTLPGILGLLKID